MFINKKNIKKGLVYFSLTCCALFCMFCLVLKFFNLSKKKINFLELISLGFIMPNGKVNFDDVKIKAKYYDLTKVVSLDLSRKKLNENKIKFSDTLKLDQQLSIDEITDFELHHKEGENTFKIIESHFGASGIKYENFYVNNKSGIDLNITQELSKKPDINIKKDGSPQVLIYHTHTCESYMDKDQGFYYESFYPRTEDKRYSVVRVGDAICKALEKGGYGSVHDTTCHDSPSFNGSYKRSAETMNRNLQRYPSIQVTIDIHRDTIGDNEKGKIKPTFKFEGKKAAQIMIMTGCDLDGSLAFPDWEYNLRLALRLQKSAETLYPGMTRSLFFGPVKYNMNKTHASLLIEVGTEVNTLNEAVRTGTFIGNALADVFNKL